MLVLNSFLYYTKYRFFSQEVLSVNLHILGKEIALFIVHYDIFLTSIQVKFE